MSSNNGFNGIPRLRFSGYNGEWEERNVEEVCTTITPPLKLQSTDYLSVGKYPIVDQSQSLICGWTNDETGLITKSPVIIFGDHTCVLKYIDFPFVQGADGVKILSPKKGYNPLYIYQALLANPVKQDGYKRHFSDLKEKTYLFPTSLEEQDRIAKCLSEEDKIISALAQKVVSLKELKKGLVQQLFPQNGETTPRLRFPGFTGEWVEKPLSDVFTRLTRKNAENNQNVLTISAQYGLISQLDFFKKSVAAADVTGYYLLSKGDFAYNKSSSQGRPVGAIKPLKLYDKGVVSTLYICFSCNNPKEIDFWEQYFDAGLLDKEIMAIAQEGARNHGLLNIPTSGFFGLSVLSPSIDEQLKIASCLSALDDTIVTETDKLEALKAHKKGLMQQLFPIYK